MNYQTHQNRVYNQFFLLQKWNENLLANRTTILPHTKQITTFQLKGYLQFDGRTFAKPSITIFLKFI